MKKIFFLVLFTLSIVISSLIVLADTNGVWHSAEDVRGGIFGSDEQGVTSGYSFINRVVFNSETLFNDYVQINSDLNVSGNIRTGGNLVATLDSSGKVPISQLPFHKGEVISPLNRLLLSGLANYDSEYFDITNLELSGINAGKVMAGVSFGPGNSLIGTSTSDATATSSQIFQGKTAYINGIKVTGVLSSNAICSSAGGTATCGSTSYMSVGTFYSMIGTNSPSGTNYCNKIEVGASGSITSTIIKTAGLCKEISSCSSTLQSIQDYPDLTSCGSTNLCQSGTCYNYNWKTNPWSACSVSCDSGVQTRTISCQRSDGVIVSDSYCINAGVKPSISQTCTMPACVKYKTTGNMLYQSRGGCGQTISIGIYNNCVLKSVSYDGDSCGLCQISGTPGGAWSIYIQDEGSRTPHLCYVECNYVDSSGVGTGIGTPCTYAGRPGITTSSGCWTGTYKYYQTGSNNIQYG